MIVPIVITITVIVLLSLSLIDLIGGKLTRLPVLMDLSNSLTLGNAPPSKIPLNDCQIAKSQLQSRSGFGCGCYHGGWSSR